MPTVARKKLTFRMPPELHGDVKVIVPLGYRRHLIEAVLRLVLTTVEGDGEPALLGILNGDYELKRKHDDD